MKFSYPAGSSKDYSNKAYYTDDYFSNPSTTYNPSLATASLCLAMSSFATNTSSSEDYTNRYINAKNLLKSFGFSSFTPNADYKKKPETDTIGLVFANKKIGSSTMVVTGIRGANYQQEWASNVTLGNYEDSTYHKGFYTAGKQLVDELKTYISDQGISGSIKLWISGYSRAGATCNIASGLLDQSVRDGTSVLGDQVSFSKEDIYSHCFEPPQGVYYDDTLDEVPAHGENYNNIFNIINGNDPVPMVAMNVYNFTRFGIDKNLSYRLSDPNYSSDIARIKNAYSNLADYSDLGGEYLIDDFSYKSISLSKDKKHINLDPGSLPPRTN